MKAHVSAFDMEKVYSMIVKFLFSRRFVIRNLLQRLHSLDKCNAVSTTEISGGTILFRAVPHSNNVCTVCQMRSRGALFNLRGYRMGWEYFSSYKDLIDTCHTVTAQS